MLIGDMLSDGLLIVEFPPSPASTPAMEIDASSLLTPTSTEVPSEGPLPTFVLAADKRKTYGRNPSYGKAYIGVEIILF